MKLNWGWRIMVLYGAFVTMMVFFVVISSHQKIDLVTADYYKDEIAYQSVLDASKNQAGLSGTLSVHAGANEVVIEFPAEFEKKAIKGNICFYAPVNKDWDRNFAVNAQNNKMSVARSSLQKTVYDVKVGYMVDGKNFYYQAQIDLHS